MTVRECMRRSIWTSAAVLCLIIAAGWTEGEAGQQGERVGINAETVLNHDPLTAAAPEIETARLAKFWTVDRFLLDEGGPVFVDKDYAWSLLAKAKPDECFNGIGEAIGNPAPDGTCARGIPKVNDP